MRRRTPFAVVVVLALTLAACGRGEGDAEPGTSRLPGELVPAGQLTPFDACDDLLDHLRTEALERVGRWGLEGGAYTVLDGTGGALRAEGDVVAAAPSAEDAGAAEPVAGQDHSTTNVQEAGIDEPDLVKTDGETIFAVAGSKLHAVTAGDEPHLVDSLDLDGFGSQLLLVGDRLLVASEGTGPLASDAAGDTRSLALPEGLALTLVDVSDPAELSVIERLDVDGRLVDARTIDDRVHVVVSSAAPSLEFTYPDAFTYPALDPGDEVIARSEQQAEDANREIVRRSTLDDWLPSFELEADGEVTASGRLTDCSSVQRAPEFAGFGSLTVLSLGPDEGLEPDASTAVLSDGELVYASPERLYVATNEWFDPRALEDGPMGDFDDRTRIHAFDLTGPGAVGYVGSGEVRGRLLDQFAMSERDGFLRVASTEQSIGPVGEPGVLEDTSESFVTVLAEQDGTLVEIGRVGGLGRGEQIHSVRFLDDVGYVVTFRQTDPLYTVDLSDPTAPRVVGELKILGYSAYLHPIGDGLLIGVGQDATDDGRRLGTQVSLFDVSDPSAPERLDQLSLGPGGSSEVEFDHHAFLYWEGLTVVPVQRFDPDSSESAIVLGIDRADGIVERAEIVHPSSRMTLAAPNGAKPLTPPPVEVTPSIQRSLVVDDTLFTLSDAGLLASDLETLTDESWVPLA